MPTACSPTFTGRLAGKTAVILNELIILVATVFVTRVDHDVSFVSLSKLHDYLLRSRMACSTAIR